MKTSSRMTETHNTYQMIIDILPRLRDDMNNADINAEFRSDLKKAISALEIVKAYY